MRILQKIPPFLLPTVGDFLLVATFLTAVVALGYRNIKATNNHPERLVVRFKGKVYANILLPIQKTFSMEGAIGSTIIRIDQYAAKVVKDPGPQQICVKQGWLKNVGDIAICAPSQISLELKGSSKVYDSTAY